LESCMSYSKELIKEIKIPKL